MFEHLKNHTTILVTGPHRSGTTIAATMIAHDTGHDLVNEEDFGFSHEPAFECFIESDYSPKVIQCPFMAKQIHFYPHCLIVWMRRDKQEIYDSVSQMRLPNGRRLVTYEFIAGELDAYNTDSDDIVAVKEENWAIQKERLPHHIELDYHELSDHPFWVDNAEEYVKKDQWHCRQVSRGMV